MTGRLFSDPRFRARVSRPTAVIPVMFQFQINSGVTESIHERGNWSLHSVAAHAEADMNGRLVFQTARNGYRFELPLIYISHLWPRALDLAAKIHLEDDRLEVFAVGANVLVVLHGARQVP